MTAKGRNAVAAPDLTLPWGVFIPPTTSHGKSDHHGYVVIIDRKGKSFQCGFSQSIVGSTGVEVGAKRPHDDISKDVNDDPGDDQCGNADADNTLGTAGTGQDKLDLNGKVSEERLHPEEALFLHTRGLLRIESFPVGQALPSEPRSGATMSTHELMKKMLPDCNISLASFLAYAHLREQGYILMRYTSKRLGLISRMNDLSRKQQEGKNSEPSEQDQNCNNNSPHPSHNGQEGNTNNCHAEFIKSELKVTDGGEIFSSEVHTKTNGDTTNGTSLSKNGRSGEVNVQIPKQRSMWMETKLELRDDVAYALPPCTILSDVSNSAKTDSIRLSYYAYNPNAQFKRTNPGTPDFGVAIMSFHSHGESGPTFDIISSLLSMCQGSDTEMIGDMDFPLRIMTVSDGGSVVAFGATAGDVPSISH